LEWALKRVLQSSERFPAEIARQIRIGAANIHIETICDRNAVDAIVHKLDALQFNSWTDCEKRCSWTFGHDSRSCASGPGCPTDATGGSTEFEQEEQTEQPNEEQTEFEEQASPDDTSEHPVPPPRRKRKQRGSDGGYDSGYDDYMRARMSQPEPTFPSSDASLVEPGGDDDWRVYMQRRENVWSHEPRFKDCATQTGDEVVREGACHKAMQAVLRWIGKADNCEDITLGMWHNKWEKLSKTEKNLAPPILSEIYPDKRWLISKDEAGLLECHLVDIPISRPEMGGPSQCAGMAFNADEVRPSKIMRLSAFMDIRSLQYVDMELFAKLKKLTMATGVVASTHAKLHRQADSFLQNYRLANLHPILVNEICHWTVLAAMIPTQSEMRGVKLMAKRSLYGAMNTATEFKREGSVIKKRFFLPNIRLSMFKPRPA